MRVGGLGGSAPSLLLSTRAGGRERRKKTLVLDLDETLIHSTSRGSRRYDFMVEVLIDKHVCLYYVYKRPHVDLFLRKAAEWFKIVIFTASMPEYADPVIDWLDGNRTIVSKRYFRQSCTARNGTFVKNLEIVESDLSQVCLIDNAPFSYGRRRAAAEMVEMAETVGLTGGVQADNGIPIDTWIDDPHDEALLDLLPFLDALRFAEDVRSVLSLRM
ncbi:Nuclear envelope morphology protein 1 [Polyrhizophydium stewartii]|uniref:Nuclear envelope morphology protein 1 n=1 Tax=Polyrhizophydium stewartii TaxID=2732419 RepID=A0ABR4NLG9_9FUNG